ncbi:ABC transporter G family member 26 [Rhizophagus clarus]|uniref:ABC transporter G family member 26 n=1 Tax=Rhizophagus clarus TaxID=94130 RepID=A0A8H3KSL0_9GLOM|nr:ABC transporter G family member 26 [Rhizophagus clarus]
MIELNNIIKSHKKTDRNVLYHFIGYIWIDMEQEIPIDGTEIKVGSGYDFSAERTKKRTLLIQHTDSRSIAVKNPVYLEWYGLSYSIPQENMNIQKNKKSELESGKIKLSILENIHGCANPGEILAIMGPSNCGKTTLLNLLGDRLGNKGVQGTITMNGLKPTKNSMKYLAYCTQDDVFFPQLTVKDTLSFNARLRLPRDVPLHDKLKRVDAIIQLLNLTKSAHTKIGNNRNRGISGGERKRVSIANELLTDPSVIMLDEPTTGLDAALALELTKILKEFAIKQRKTIIIVIHQPSSQDLNVTPTTILQIIYWSF